MKKKALAKSFALILSAFILTGCSKPDIKSPIPNEVVETTPSPAISDKQENSDQVKDIDQVKEEDQASIEDPTMTPEENPTDASTDNIAGTRLAEDENSLDLSGPITGIYQGQIDSHSIEVLVGDQYVVLNADDISQYLEGLEKDDKVEFTATISASDQMMLENIVKLK